MRNTGLNVVLKFGIFVILLFNSCVKIEKNYYIEDEYRYKLFDKTYLVYENQDNQTDTFNVIYDRYDFIFSGETEGREIIYSETEEVRLYNSDYSNDSSNLYFVIARSANYLIFEREFSSGIGINGQWVLNSNHYIQLYAEYQIADQIYKNVFYFYDPDIAPALNLIHKFYYTHQYGIIKYEKSNGESWELITK